MDEHHLPLLNHYEIAGESGGSRHLIALIEPVRAGAEGFDARVVVGEFTPDDRGEFDPESFVPNPEFIEAFMQYMNAEAAGDPEVIARAEAERGGRLYLIDPRRPFDPDAGPPAEDVLGCFDVDDVGRVVPGSFQYNTLHRWIAPQAGPSRFLADRRFYDWLHAPPAGG